MSLFDTVKQIYELGVTVASPEVGRIKLVSSAENVPVAAVELAKQHKPALVLMLQRSRSLPPCAKCTGQQLAIPTRDGYENFECLRCDCCSGCARIVKHEMSNNVRQKQHKQGSR
jgi:DNA-binding NarL/FixJ family response regulator